MMSGLLRRFVVVLVVGCFVLLCINAVWAATSITTPSTNPFSVPADGQFPASFTLIGSGWPQGVGEVSVEQCDGVASSTVGWSPVADCDIATAPIAVDVGANGIA